MAREVYSRLMEFKGIRLHLRVHSDEQLEQRKRMLEKYLFWCMNMRRGSAQTYVSYLDHVAGLHQTGRNRIPATHLLAGLAIAQDTFMRHLCANNLDKAQLQRSACAVSKIMWIQAIFFVKHVHQTRCFKLRRFCGNLITILAALTCSRQLTGASGQRRLRAVLTDAVVATMSSLLLGLVFE